MNKAGIETRKVYRLLKIEAVHKRFKQLSLRNSDNMIYPLEVRYEILSVEFFLSPRTLSDYMGEDTQLIRKELLPEQLLLLKNLEQKITFYKK